MYTKHGISLPKQFKIELAFDIVELAGDKLFWHRCSGTWYQIKKVWCINLPWSKYMGTWFKYVARHINNNNN